MSDLLGFIFLVLFVFLILAIYSVGDRFKDLRDEIREFRKDIGRRWQIDREDKFE